MAASQQQSAGQKAGVSPADALRVAVDRLGSQAAMARLCGVSQPTVWRWLDGGKSLPAELVLKVESATGMSKFELRPDLYEREAVDPALQARPSDMVPVQ